MSSIPSLPSTAVQNSIEPVAANVAPSTRAVKEALDAKASSADVTGAATVAKINAQLGSAAWQGGGGGSGGSAAWGSIGGTLASQTDLQAALDAKSGSGHGHLGLVPSGGAAGQVLKKVDATAYNATWQDDATGTGGAPASQAEAEAGAENTKFMTALRSLQSIVANAKNALLTGYAAGTNTVVLATDTIMQAIGKLQAQLSGKADLLAPRTESASFTITRAAHANRVVTYTGSGAGQATLDGTSALVEGDTIHFYQAFGAGALSIAGADVALAEGVGGALTTGPRNSLVCMFDGTKLVVTQRNQPDATGGGGGSAASYTSIADIVAPNDLLENLVLTLPLGTCANGQLLKISTWLEQTGATATADGGNIYYRINGQTIAQVPMPPSYGVGKFVHFEALVKSQTLVLGIPPGTSGYGEAGDALMRSTANIAGGATLTVFVQKFGTGKTLTINGVHVLKA